MSGVASDRTDLPIGVFDSGVGGLTVLDALARRLPAENLLYLGDTARVPYGTRSPETVVRYSERVAGHLYARGIKALVVACNTATTWALPALEATGERLGVPVIGVIRPGAARALAITRTQHIAVIGTEGTVRGRRYEEELRAAAPEVRVDALACPLFVSLAEEGWTSGPIAALVAERYLAPLRGGADTLILGCTHYPLLSEAIAQALPGVTLVDSASATADAVAATLASRGLARRGGAGKQSYLVTDNLARFLAVGEHFLGREPWPAQVVDIDETDHAAWTTFVEPADTAPRTADP